MATTKSVKNGMVDCDVKLHGKTVIITGANTGIGLPTTIDMAKRGAKVIMACRNAEKASAARKVVLEEAKCGEDKVICKSLDLSSFASVRKFAEDINATEDHLDILINNAGVMACPLGRTEDGFETQFGVNHLGHFLLTNLLLDLIKKSAPSRIVVLTSLGHKFWDVNWNDINWEKSYTDYKAYSSSKTMNVLFTRHLAKLLEESNVTVNCVHPGSVHTDLQRHVYAGTGSRLFRWVVSLSQLPIIDQLFAKWVTPEQGAQTSIYLAVAPELDGVTGRYFTNCAIAEEAGHAKNNENAEKLWKMSLEWTKLSEN